MGMLDGTSRVTSSEGEHLTSTWTFSKIGISMTLGDVTLTTEPLAELPRRIILNF
jgi:hypothetical protein